MILGQRVKTTEAMTLSDDVVVPKGTVGHLTMVVSHYVGENTYYVEFEGYKNPNAAFKAIGCGFDQLEEL